MKDHVDPRQKPSDPAGDSDRSPLLDWVVSNGKVAEVFDEVSARLRRRRMRRASAIAAGLAVVAVAAFVLRSFPVSPNPAMAPSTASIILPVKKVLPDGSTVELKDETRIAIAFTDAVRRVVLQSGEGHFKVVRDARRPFLVVAGGVEVRAVGTAFSVQINPRAVEVLVTEGSVSVDRPEEKAAVAPAPLGDDAISLPPPVVTSLAVVAAGNRVVVDIHQQSDAPPPSVVAVSVEELNDRLSWRIPRLEFVGTPLAEVVPMFNQHARIQLAIGDAALGSLELSGTIRADNTDSLLRLLRDQFGIKTERRGNEVVLRR